ncbi:hypothetical protein PINS_up022283, partial [Pythium insidiosum]
MIAPAAPEQGFPRDPPSKSRIWRKGHVGWVQPTSQLVASTTSKPDARDNSGSGTESASSDHDEPASTVVDLVNAAVYMRDGTVAVSTETPMPTPMPKPSPMSMPTPILTPLSEAD